MTFNKIATLSAAASAVVAIGLGVYMFGGFSQQSGEGIPLSEDSLTSTPHDVDTDMSADVPDVDAVLVGRLIAEEGLDRETATLIARIDTRVKTYDNLHLSYEQTLSGQGSWDVRIKVIPNEIYAPTEAELRAESASGNGVYRVRYSTGEIGGIPQITLRYFVPYQAMPDALKASIQSSGSGPSASAATVNFFLPAAEASGGAAGAVFETIIKGLAKEGLNKLADFNNLFAAIDILTGYIKLSESKSYFSELDQLKACAENPTNLLTRKAYAESPSEKARVLDQVNSAESQLNQLTIARILNLAAKTGAKFTGANFAGKLFLDSVAKWSDETLKEVAEGWIDDARKAVVECEQAATRLNGTIQYSESSSSESCLGPGGQCYEVKEQRSGSGNFLLTTSGTTISGNGTGTFDQTRTKITTKKPDHYLTSYDEGYQCALSGDVRIVVQGAKEPPPVRLTVFGGDYLSEDCTATSYVKGEARHFESHHDATTGLACSFEDLDLVKGGTYEVAKDGGNGSCTLKLSPM